MECSGDFFFPFYEHGRHNKDLVQVTLYTFRSRVVSGKWDCWVYGYDTRLKLKDFPKLHTKNVVLNPQALDINLFIFFFPNWLAVCSPWWYLSYSTYHLFVMVVFSPLYNWQLLEGKENSLFISIISFIPSFNTCLLLGAYCVPDAVMPLGIKVNMPWFLPSRSSNVLANHLQCSSPVSVNAYSPEEKHWGL